MGSARPGSGAGGALVVTGAEMGTLTPGGGEAACAGTWRGAGDAGGPGAALGGAAGVAAAAAAG